MLKIKRRHLLSLGLMLAICVIRVSAQQAADPATIEKVSVRGKSNALRVEVIVSRPTVPNVMTLNNPDRLVLDFRNTEPGRQPQRTPVNRGGIGTVRIGEDGGSPPTTRVVLDLLQPREFKLVQNRNSITLVPASSHSSATASPPPNEPQADPPDSADGSVKTKGGSVASTAPSRSGSDPTYSPPAQSLVGESSSKKDADDIETADLTTQPDQPAAALLNTLPLQVLPISSLLGAPTARAVADQVSEQSRLDLKAHNQRTNAMLASSETVPAMAGSSSTTSNAVLPSTGSDSVAVTTSQPSQKMEDRKLAASNGADRDFVIGPGDVLAINVWKEPDISRVIPVRSDGKISLPLVGELQAAGQTPRQLESEISGALRAYIAEPTVAVIVQEIRSRRYNVLGQVAKPGSYMLLNSATVLDAIAIAGGFKDFAKKKSIYVLRRTTDGKEQRLPFNYTKVIKGAELDQNIPLRPGDTIVVP